MTDILNTGQPHIHGAASLNCKSNPSVATNMMEAHVWCTSKCKDDQWKSSQVLKRKGQVFKEAG